MSKIFISHSSANNAAALALATYLQENGWTDYFLDVSAEQGLLPGERWQAALKSAADRCEAVVFLISPAWRDSRWCLAEFLLAKQLGKKIFGVLVEPTPLDTLPVEMTAEWQLCDLTRGDERRTFTVHADGVIAEMKIGFSETGLARFRSGLRKAGLDPSTFPWPPAGDPDRAPYRGLKSLDVDDAAVLFGREVAITRGLDEIRRMRDRGLEGLFVILGASGAGKSSFLRAGLWPRLARDDSQFLPLPVIRPRGAVMNGPGGFVESLEAALRTHKIVQTRADIRVRLDADTGFASMLDELRRTSAQTEPAASLPTIVVPIDQGEELFLAEGRREAERFLALLSHTLDQASNGKTGGRACVAIIGIRSDAYERLQSEPLLTNARQVPFNLSPIARGEFKRIITGPAEQSTANGRPLRIDPVLTERLLQDAEGPDALPLLAFTLERLLLDYGSDGELSAADYESLGGVRGSIEAAIESAFANPGETPAVPVDHEERERLLRRAFIPWLARIDPDTDQPRRRVATLDEIPREAQNVLARLINARLVVSDRRELDGRGTTVLEVAHEALLRQWRALTTWLDEDADALKTLEAVRRAAQEWNTHGRRPTWLVHTADRLQHAEQLRSRPDLDQSMGAAGREYLMACRARDEQVRIDREAQFARIAAEQAATARAQRRARIALVSVAAILTLSAAWTVTQIRSVARQQAAMLTAAAEDALNKRQFDRSLRFAVLAARNSWLSPTVAGAEPQLVRSASASTEIARFATGGTVSAELSPDGEHVVATFADGARVFDVALLREILRIPDPHGTVSASFSPDGKRLAVGSQDGTTRVLDAWTGQTIVQIPGTANYGAARFSPDGRRLMRNDPRGILLFDVDTGKELVKLGISGTYESISFSSDSRQVTSALSDDIYARVWDIDTGREITSIVHGTEVTVAAFSPDGKVIATASKDKGVLISDAATGNLIAQLSHYGDSIAAAQFSPDGTRLLTMTAPGLVRLFDTATWKETSRFLPAANGTLNSTKSISFTSDGRQIIVSAQTTGLFDGFTGTRLAAFDHDTWCSSNYSVSRHHVVSVCEDKTLRLYSSNADRVAGIVHEDRLESVAYSPDGTRIVTASDDQTARVVDARTGEEVSRGMHKSYVQWAGFSPDGRLIATRSLDNAAAVFDAATGREVLRVDHGHGDAIEGNDVESVAFSPDGRRIVTASRDRTARIIDVQTGKEVMRVLHGARVTSAAFSPEGHRIVTGSWDGTARVIDVDTGREIMRVAPADRVHKATFTPDGRRIVTIVGLMRREFDAQNGTEIGIATKVDPDRLLSPRGRLVLTHGNGGLVLANIHNGLALARLGPAGGSSEFETSASFDPDGKHVVTITDDRMANIWDLSDALDYEDDLITFVCRHKLVGTSRLTEGDVAAVPLLQGRAGEDVCRRASLLQRLFH